MAGHADGTDRTLERYRLASGRRGDPQWSIRDLPLACSVLADPDGEDAFATCTVPFDAGIGSTSDRKLRVGWRVGPGFGPIDAEAAAAARSAAEAFKPWVYLDRTG